MNNDFEEFYDNWMITTGEKISPCIVVNELIECIRKKYPEKATKENDETYGRLYDKALAMQQKIAMMQYAVSNYHKSKKDFESTQNMDIPALYGMGKTKIIFYLESAIVFARNALDVGAYIYSNILLNCRKDSFNELCKKIEKNDDPTIVLYMNRLGNLLQY